MPDCDYLYCFGFRQTQPHATDCDQGRPQDLGRGGGQGWPDLNQAI